MYEDANGTLVPGSVLERAMHNDYHYRVLGGQYVTTSFDNQAPTEPNQVRGEEIDGDEDISKMLKEFGF